VNDNSTKVTSRKLPELLQSLLAKVEAKFNAKPQILLDEWPKIVGPEIASMARAERFDDGVLYVKVKNSTLLSLLSNPHDKKRLIENIKQKLSGISIRNIVFRIG
jgi:predicted nucleic acid-binding Zn ribbon protein